MPIDDRYGPGALLTPANMITILRLVLTPALLVMIVEEPTSWAAAAFWTVLAFSDGIDGHLARKHGTTRSGAFLDPLADKVLVLGALFALVAAGRFWIVPGAAHRRPRGRHQRLPHPARPPGPGRPGPDARQGEDRRPGVRRRRSPCSRSPATTTCSPPRCCGSPSP